MKIWLKKQAKSKDSTLPEKPAPLKACSLSGCIRGPAMPIERYMVYLCQTIFKENKDLFPR